MAAPKSVAVLGGGISGLACAYRLSKLCPNTQITILERQNRVGGWLQSQSHSSPLDASASAIFEAGPRTMRPKGIKGWLTLALVDEIGLSPSLLTVDKDHDSAKNRFVYFPNQLNKLPSSLLSLVSAMSQPALRGVVPAIMKEPLQPASKLSDESVDTFFRRRFGSSLAENLISAMIRGIYAGDSKRLSIRALFPSLWKMEQKSGSVLRGMLFSKTTVRAENEQKMIRELQQAYSDQKVMQSLQNASVWGLRGGMQALALSLEEKLRSNPKITIRLGTEVESIRKSDSGEFTFQIAEENHALTVDHVVASLPSSALSQLYKSRNLPTLSSVSVAVVNLAYLTPTNSSSLLPVSGFGYLIPQSTPAAQNPHKALGVVFDTDSMPLLDQDSRLTKLSVLMGGHQWSSYEDMPEDAELINGAIDTVRMHLGVEEKPVLQVVHRQKDCIPQYTVGHVQNMTDLHSVLSQEETGLTVIGASYAGVGVNDCIYSGLQAAERLAKTGKATGLEDMMEEQHG